MSRLRSSGGILVEFSLILPVSVLFFYGVMDFSSAWRVKHALHLAAREGARVASITPRLALDDPRVIDILDGQLRGVGVDPNRCFRSVQFSAPIKDGDPVTVIVRCPFQTTLGRLHLDTGDTMNLEAVTVMSYENPPPPITGGP